jgi:uncharacterized membrane protein
MKAHEVVYWVCVAVAVILNVWSMWRYYKPGPDPTRDTAYFAAVLAGVVFVMVVCVAHQVFGKGGRP